MYHKSVLLDECIENLNIVSDGIYVDATLGYAGHSSEILKRIPEGHLYGFDQDDFATLKSDITEALYPFIYNLTGRKPIILPIILDIKR